MSYEGQWQYGANLKISRRDDPWDLHTRSEPNTRNPDKSLEIMTMQAIHAMLIYDAFDATWCQ